MSCRSLVTFFIKNPVCRHLCDTVDSHRTSKIFLSEAGKHEQGTWMGTSLGVHLGVPDAQPGQSSGTRMQMKNHILLKVT